MNVNKGCIAIYISGENAGKTVRVGEHIPKNTNTVFQGMPILISRPGWYVESTNGAYLITSIALRVNLFHRVDSPAAIALDEELRRLTPLSPQSSDTTEKEKDRENPLLNFNV